MVDFIQTIGELDAFKLALCKSDKVVYDTFFINVEVIYGSREEIRLDYLPGCARLVMLSGGYLALHGLSDCRKDRK
jgi:hypothetical protein